MQPKNWDYDTYVPSRKYRSPLSTSDDGSLALNAAGGGLAPPKQVRVC